MVVSPLQCGEKGGLEARPALCPSSSRQRAGAEQGCWARGAERGTQRGFAGEAEALSNVKEQWRAQQDERSSVQLPWVGLRSLDQGRWWWQEGGISVWPSTGSVGLPFLVRKDVWFSRADPTLKADGEEKGRQPVVGLGLASAWTCCTGLAAIGAYVNVGHEKRELVLSTLLSLEESLSILTSISNLLSKTSYSREAFSSSGCSSSFCWEFFPCCLNLKL